MKRYLRQQYMPHIWCPGCGNGIVLGALLRAISRLGWDQDRIAVVSGIGCSSRATGYLDFDTLHTTHGRALAFATGLKLARPELKVIVVGGDGDLAAIGGNHLIHAARRNIDITTICVNNRIYGMTSGQASPLTPKGRLATTAPYGNVDRPFDLCQLVQAAGATYVARSTTYHVRQLCNLIAEALENRGFSFVEAVAQCPVYYGRRNRLGTAVDMLKYYRDHAVTVRAAQSMQPEQLADKIIIGRLHHVVEPDYESEYARVMEEARRRADR